MGSIRLLLAAPFMMVAAVAFFVMGFQFILAVLAWLSGAGLVAALTLWIVNTIVLGVVGTVAGVLAWVVGGPAVRGTYQDDRLA
jgi:uncharacterized protein (DUF2062 family)